MYFARLIAALMAVFLAGCGNMGDDLSPSGADERGSGQAIAQTLEGSIGFADIAGAQRTFAGEMENADALVFYFTMWCPVCDSHTSHMLRYMVDSFPGVRFYLVDYVSGSVSAANASAMSAGYGATAGLSVIADFDGGLTSLFSGTMGTTVVVDKNMAVRLNEDYKDGARLKQTLEGL